MDNEEQVQPTNDDIRRLSNFNIGLVLGMLFLAVIAALQWKSITDLQQAKVKECKCQSADYVTQEELTELAKAAAEAVIALNVRVGQLETGKLDVVAFENYSESVDKEIILIQDEMKKIQQCQCKPEDKCKCKCKENK